MTIDESEYTELKKDFDREYKRIQPYKTTRPLTADLNLRAEYKNCIVATYNEIISFVCTSYAHFTQDEIKVIQNRLTALRSKLKECFEILKVTYKFEPNLLQQIDIDKITEITDTSPIDNNSNHSGTINSDSDSDSAETVTDNTQPQNVQLANNMAQSAPDFIRLANQTLHVRFDGDPSALECFLDGIDLLKDLCEEQNKGTFLKFVKTRLEGKARELIGDPKDVDEIVSVLKASIKPESSKVIEGRFLALRADKCSLFKFSERAEKLAEQLNRSLFVEGYSKEKAMEITIDKTVEMCLKSVKHDRIKSVLDSTVFSDPKEVISKMITQINKLKQDGPHSSYIHKFGNQNKNNSQSNSRGQSNNQNGHRGNQNKSQNNYNNSRQNNNGQSNGNYNGKSYNKNGQSSYGNHGNRNNYNQGQQGNQTIRQFSGNETNPGNSGQSQNQ